MVGKHSTDYVAQAVGADSEYDEEIGDKEKTAHIEAAHIEAAHGRESISGLFLKCTLIAARREVPEPLATHEVSNRPDSVFPFRKKSRVCKRAPFPFPSHPPVAA
jgi:hypothetical protein